MLGYVTMSDERQLGLVMEMMNCDMRSHIDQTKVELRKGNMTSIEAGNQFLAIARQIAAGMVCLNIE